MNAASSPKPTFEARRVVGVSGRRVTARAVVVSSGSPGRTPWGRWGEPTEAAFGPFARLGLVAIGLGTVGLLLVLAVPWMHEVDGEDFSRKELQTEGPPLGDLAWDDERPYTRGLTRTPVSATIWLGVAGFLLIVADAIPASRLGQALVRLGLLGAIGFSSLQLVAIATRWFGLYASKALEPGPLSVHLHVGLYAVLIVGLVGIAATHWGLRVTVKPFFDGPEETSYESAFRWSAWTVVLAAAGLALAPVLPIASSVEDGVHLSELEVMQGGDPPAPHASEGLRRTVEDLAVTRLTLWLVLALASFSALAALLHRTGVAPLLSATLLQVYAFNYLILGVAVVMTALLYGNHIQYIDRFPGFRQESGFIPLWNWVLPAALFALAYAGVRYGMGVVLPFVRREVRAGEGVAE